MNNPLRNTEYRDFVQNHVILNQSSLVESLLRDESYPITYEDIRNAYDEEHDEYREIFEWWVCDPRLLAKLEEKGKPVLRTDFGNWWGRCTTGQACYLDDVLQEIWNDLNHIT